MSGFDELHPALQHHIVNSLGWREMRPFQDAVIPPILRGEHMVVLAPTAGGKTEAAFFPVLSRMLSEGWSGLSALYLCPIKALLNNLDSRLQRYCSLVGRRAAPWHGDVKSGARRHILRDPPDCLLTTPESLEVMLVSPNVDARRLFGNLRVVVVDEIHAFAGDDRGWHLLSVLERIARLAGRELQRIGLSATVGNPDALVDWLAGGCPGPQRVSRPQDAATVAADVTLDHVGSLYNAAIVISRLHRGEKRLVFVDSRARAEQLGADLRQLGVTAFVTHSSLSPEQRHQAEDAFANRDDCAIVTTSVLELGIDVGNLDRVIQIDSPRTVSSLLQRMGRTGRRAGTTRNCLFLATRDESLLQAAGLIDLWSSGYVEPVEPPAAPYHVLAQQLMALILQEQGIGRQTWFDWISGVPAFAELSQDQVNAVVEHMLQENILWDEEGILGIGRAGEERYGRRNFMELLSVFLSPPLFRVLHGRRDLGSVDELTFLGRQNGPHILLLGGQSWRVTYVDWSHKTASVEPCDERGRSRWKGEGYGLRYRLCQAMKRVLTTEDDRTCWSRRACEHLNRLREEFDWLTESDTVLLSNAAGELVWWTFAGQGANSSLAPSLAAALQCHVAADSLSLRFEYVPPADAARVIHHLRERSLADFCPDVDESAVQSLKFADCLPQAVAVGTLRQRLRDDPGLEHVLGAELRLVAPSQSSN